MIPSINVSGRGGQPAGILCSKLRAGYIDYMANIETGTEATA